MIPNPWDAGSARHLASFWFSALATSGSAAAGTLGRADYGLTRDEARAMARAIVETIRLAVARGLAGCSIEDARGDAAPYDFNHAVERIAATVEANRALPHLLMLTARAENFARDRADLDATIARLQAFARAGADVLFAPGLSDLAAIRTVCAAVLKPGNVVAGSKGRLPRTPPSCDR